MTDSKTASAFEQICAAYHEGAYSLGYKETGRSWADFVKQYPHLADETRRGMLAALREIKEDCAGCNAHDMLDELIRQGEQDGPGAG